MNLSLRQIRAFVCVCDSPSVTQAAQKLHLTQSAVSMLIQQFEEQTGVVLFDRHKGRLTPTPQAQALLPQAQHILHKVDAMALTLHNMQRQRTETLKVAVPQLLACTWLPQTLERFAQQCPQVHITVVDGTADHVLQAVQAGEADIGIGPERACSADIQRDKLSAIPMVLVFSNKHPFAQKASVAWAELERESWIAYSSEFNHFLAQIFTDHGMRLSERTVTQVTHLTTAFALAGQGMGVTAVPLYASQLLGSFDLACRRLHAPALAREFFIYQRKGRTLSRATQSFCQHLAADMHQQCAAG